MDYQTRMVRSAKEVARVAQDMVAHASHDPSRLTPLAADLSHHYAALAADARGAMAATASSDVSADFPPQRNSVAEGRCRASGFESPPDSSVVSSMLSLDKVLRSIVRPRTTYHEGAMN